MRAIHPEIISNAIEIRHDIHRHPELAYQEHRTSDLVARKLTEWGYRVVRGLGETGLVGQLQRGEGKLRIGIRADMDALPIREASGKSWASQQEGVMHACGHDGHTAILLATAEGLAQSHDWQGTVNLIFQPAEEGGAGADRMIKDGLFQQFPCDFIYGLHNMPGYPQGQLLFRHGPMMASADFVKITLEGVGGHGAMPHLTYDPIVAGASLVMALQTIVSRNIDPLEPSVITIGTFHAGKADNIIPPRAELELSVRGLNRAVRATLLTRIRELATHHAQSYGLTADVSIEDGYPVLINDHKATDLAIETARRHFPQAQITVPGPTIMGSEDFAFMLEAVPGCYFFIGNGELGENGGCMIHNPAYDFHDHNIKVGAEFWLALIHDLLGK